MVYTFILSIGPWKTGRILVVALSTSQCGGYKLGSGGNTISESVQYCIRIHIIKAGILNCILFLSRLCLLVGVWVNPPPRSTGPQWHSGNREKKLRHSSVRNLRLLTPRVVEARGTDEPE